MLLFLIFTPIINYLEAKFFIFPSEQFYLSFVISLYATTMVITSYLAINHFRLAIKRRKLNNKLYGSDSTNFETTRNMSKPIIKMALILLDNIRQQLIDGECDEADIQCAMTKFHPEKNGYFKQEDFVTADKAMKILHLGCNRVKFFELTK